MLVSLEMVFVIRDATLRSVSLMEIVDLKDNELSVLFNVCTSHLYACTVAMYTRCCVCLFVMEQTNNKSIIRQPEGFNK